MSEYKSPAMSIIIYDSVSLIICLLANEYGLVSVALSFTTGIGKYLGWVAICVDHAESRERR